MCFVASLMRNTFWRVSDGRELCLRRDRDTQEATGARSLVGIGIPFEIKKSAAAQYFALTVVVVEMYSAQNVTAWDGDCNGHG